MQKSRKLINDFLSSIFCPFEFSGIINNMLFIFKVSEPNYYRSRPITWISTLFPEAMSSVHMNLI